MGLAQPGGGGLTCQASQGVTDCTSLIWKLQTEAQKFVERKSGFFIPSNVRNCPEDALWVAGDNATQLTARSFPSSRWTQVPGLAGGARACAFRDQSSDSPEPGAVLLEQRNRNCPYPAPRRGGFVASALRGRPGLGTQTLPDLVATPHCPEEEPGRRNGRGWPGQAASAKKGLRLIPESAEFPLAGSSAALMATLLADDLE